MNGYMSGIDLYRFFIILFSFLFFPHSWWDDRQVTIGLLSIGIYLYNFVIVSDCLLILFNFLEISGKGIVGILMKGMVRNELGIELLGLLYFALLGEFGWIFD